MEAPGEPAPPTPENALFINCMLQHAEIHSLLPGALGLPQKNFAFFEKGIAAGSGELLNTSLNCAVGRSSYLNQTYYKRIIQTSFPAMDVL